MTCLGVLLGIDINTAGDAMDVGPPPVAKPSKPEPKSEPKKSADNLTKEQAEVRKYYHLSIFRCDEERTNLSYSDCSGVERKRTW
jgi:hypothetical protein